MMSQRIRHEYGGFANKVNEVGSLAPERGRLARAGPSCFCRKSTGINHSVAIPAVTLQYRHIAISHTREAPQFMSCNGVNYYKNTQLSISKRLPTEDASSRRFLPSGWPLREMPLSCGITQVPVLVFRI
jgi:hypothetical protein